MKTNALLWMLAGCATAPASPPAGSVTLELNNEVTSRKIVSAVWFEAAEGASIEEVSIRPPLRALLIASDAVPAPAPKRPLIVISHGNWGSRYSQGWLASKLVELGYVVLTVTHPGTSGDDQSVAGRYRLWDRSRDVSFALDELLSDPKWSALIDPTRIGFVGHSFGGWTGVSLAGGRYDPARERTHCETRAIRDIYCDTTLKDDISTVPASDATDSFEDRRLRAFYLLATGPSSGFDPRSLETIRAPFLIETAQFDDVLEPTANSTALARHIPGAREVVRPVGHFAYAPECKSIVGPLLAWVAGIPICDDSKGIDRSAAHSEIARDVVRFFDEVLTKP